MGEFVVDFPTLGDLGDAWITQHCRVPQGFARGRAYEMADWQYWCHANRYRVREDARFVAPEDVGPDNPPVLNQAFVYQKTLVVGPQKTGKGPYSASQVAFEAVGPSVFAGWARGGEVYRCADNGCGCGFEWRYESGEPMGMRHPSPLIQITAFSEDQAGNIYNALKGMVQLGPLKKLLLKRQGFMRIKTQGDIDDDDLDRIDVVTASANSRLGNPISDAEQDEAGLWTPTNRMIDVADTQARGVAGMGGRVHLTTNTWDPAANSYAQQVYEADEPDVFVFYRNPDLVPDLVDRSTSEPISFLSKANRRKVFDYVYEGSWWVNLDSIEGEASKLMRRDPAQAERFFGNRLVQGLGAFLSAPLWDTRTDVGRGAPESGADVCLGFDGSGSGDWTAIRAETMDGFRFTPTYGPDKRPTYWDPKTWPEGRIPRTEVDAAVTELMATYKVARFYCDPRLFETQIDQWSSLYGDDVVVQWPTNQTSRMYLALLRYQEDLHEGLTTHSDDAVAKSHALHAIKVAQRGDKFILGKPAEHMKIDILMSDVLTHEAAADMRAEGWQRAPRKVIVRSRR